MKIEDFKVGQKVVKILGTGIGRKAIVTSVQPNLVTLMFDGSRDDYFVEKNPESWRVIPQTSPVFERFDYISELDPTIKMKALKRRSGFSHEPNTVYLSISKNEQYVAGVYLSSEGLRQMAQDLVAMANELDKEE